MARLLAHLRVEDYDKWLATFDANLDMRKAAGSIGASIFHNRDDANSVFVLLSWNDMEQARAFLDSPELRATMQRAGVIGKPDAFFLDEIGSRDA